MHFRSYTLKVTRNTIVALFQIKRCFEKYKFIKNSFYFTVKWTWKICAAQIQHQENFLKTIIQAKALRLISNKALLYLNLKKISTNFQCKYVDWFIHFYSYKSITLLKVKFSGVKKNLAKEYFWKKSKLIHLGFKRLW